MAGAFFGEGRGDAQDQEQAIAWFLKTAQQGIAQAQFNATTYFDQGRGGVAVDHKAAFELYLKAAHQGLVMAQTNVGNRFYEGRGTPQDDRQAVRGL